VTSAIDYNAAQLAAGALTAAHITELVRFWQAGHKGLEVDGMAGPATIATISAPPVRFLLCPMPTLTDGRAASITSSFRPEDRPNHDGCDWFYAWKLGDQPAFVGDRGAAGRQPDGNPKWVVPNGVCAIAAADGVVQLAGDSVTGHRVWIDHGNGLRSGYFHLMDTRVTVGQQIARGTPVGLVGDNPADNDGRHLHFEVSPVGRYSPLDPQLYLLV
jgi:murein DD-endopeptidase MepM/ murein hydrolase activator NlpD